MEHKSDIRSASVLKNVYPVAIGLSMQKPEISIEQQMIDVLPKIHELLKGFSRDDRQRIIAAANALIGNKP